MLILILDKVIIINVLDQDQSQFGFDEISSAVTSPRFYKSPKGAVDKTETNCRKG